jgi:hypothetical protein
LGTYTIRWDDDDGGVAAGCRGITWYYATRPDGSDRKRMTTHYRDDFTGYLARWRPDGPFNFDWKLTRDPGRGHVLAAPNTPGGILYSREPAINDVVISVLARPRNLRNDVILGFRVGLNGTGYELRTQGNILRVLQEGQPVAGGEARLLGVTPRKWHWYEVGLRSRRNKEVEIRVRVFDEDRRLLTCVSGIEDRPHNRMLLRRGVIALAGSAEFAELYVDRWAARWADDTENEVTWDTSQVPEGEYYIVAELAAQGQSPPELVVSPYRVQVRAPAARAAN